MKSVEHVNCYVNEGFVGEAMMMIKLLLLKMWEKFFENFSNKGGRKMGEKEVIKLFFGKFCLILLLIGWMYRIKDW